MHCQWGVPVTEPLASFLSRHDSLRARDPVPPVRRVEHTQPLPKATAKVEHGVILDVTRDARPLCVALYATCHCVSFTPTP
jgi:hypothetical protein